MKTMTIVVLCIGVAILSGCGSCSTCGACSNAYMSSGCSSCGYSSSGCGVCDWWHGSSGCSSCYVPSSGCSSCGYMSAAYVDPQPPSLCLTVAAPAAVRPCDTMCLKYVVRNTGCKVACNVVVNADLPYGWNTPDGRNSLCFSAGRLAPGQSREFTARVRADTPGMFTTQAIATADGGGWMNAQANTNVIEPSCPPCQVTAAW